MENKSLRVRANAKVNLALHVVGKLPSGLHLLDSLVAFPAFGDELVFERAEGLSLSVTGPFSNELLQENKSVPNLVMKAAHLIKGSNHGAAITLIKNLPIASGIGGGSSDAAMTIKALCQFWNRQIPPLDDILKLGSDVPVCLSNGLQRMQGVGEKTTLLPMPSAMWIVLANPGIKVSTRKIFGFLQNKNNDVLERLENKIIQDSFFSYLRRQRNDLETVACELFPEVKLMLGAIKATSNCKLCRMSGSGATCFGLYAEKDFAIKAVDNIKENFPNAWAISAPLFSTDPSYNELGQIYK